MKHAYVNEDGEEQGVHLSLPADSLPARKSSTLCDVFKLMLLKGRDNPKRRKITSHGLPPISEFLQACLHNSSIVKYGNGKVTITISTVNDDEIRDVFDGSVGSELRLRLPIMVTYDHVRGLVHVSSRGVSGTTAGGEEYAGSEDDEGAGAGREVNIFNVALFDEI